MDRRVKLYWVDFSGELKLYGELGAGETRQQNTYAGHTWLVTDENDAPVGHFVAQQNESRAVIPRQN